MKRFAVFAGDNYYPGGGMGDFIKSFDTAEEARAFVEELKTSPTYPNLFNSKEPRDAWAQTKFGKYDWHNIEDMEEYE